MPDFRELINKVYMYHRRHFRDQFDYRCGQYLMGLIEMNTGYIRNITIILVITMAIAGWASAVSPTSALYDNTGITTTIDATCIGTFIVNHDMEWQQTNNPNASLLNVSLTPEEKRAIFAYTENTMGADGTTRYTKQFGMNGGNVSEGRNNLDVRHTVNYKTDDNGRLLWNEVATMTAAGTAGATDESKCTFASDSKNSAGYDATVTAGSVMNVKEVAAVTEVGARAISENSGVPVNLKYGFDAQGIGTDEGKTLAEGSAQVFMNTHSVTGDPGDANVTTKIYDRQRTLANGLFDLTQTHEYGSTS